MPTFEKIRARAADRKGGEAALASLLGTAPDNAAVATLSDDRMLSTMAERVFRGRVSSGGSSNRNGRASRKRSSASSPSGCCSSPRISGMI